MFYKCASVINGLIRHNNLTVTTLVNVNAPVVATTNWWLHFTAPVVA